MTSRPQNIGICPNKVSDNIENHTGKFGGTPTIVNKIRVG